MEQHQTGWRASELQPQLAPSLILLAKVPHTDAPGDMGKVQCYLEY